MFQNVLEKCCNRCRRIFVHFNISTESGPFCPFLFSDIRPYWNNSHRHLDIPALVMCSNDFDLKTKLAVFLILQQLKTVSKVIRLSSEVVMYIADLLKIYHVLFLTVW